MNKTELAKKIAGITGLSFEQSTVALNAVLGIISSETMNKNSVTIPDFGRFQIKVLPPKKGRNPKTNETITVPEREKITFKAFENFPRYAFKYLPSGTDGGRQT